MNIVLFSLTCVSVGIASLAMFFAWRTVSAARRESDLRVAALSADLHGGGDDVGAVRLSAPLFQVETSEVNDGRGRVVLVAGALVIGTVLSLVVGLSALGRSADASSVNRTPTAPPPLELVALGHDRSANQLTVRGVVRNPAAGHEIDGLTAVVLLYNTDGSYVATDHALLAQPALMPGAESTFSITMPDQAALGRYRVSFRAGDRVIAHVDQRTARQDR